jgi:hypothetical protein
MFGDVVDHKVEKARAALPVLGEEAQRHSATARNTNTETNANKFAASDGKQIGLFPRKHVIPRPSF